MHGLQNVKVLSCSIFTVRNTPGKGMLWPISTLKEMIPGTGIES